MPRVPPRSTQQVEQLLRHFGRSFVRHGSGHDIWGPGAREQNFAVPRARSSGEMKSRTVEAILEEAGISVADALAFWKVR
jgi:hypothetical protein